MSRESGRERSDLVVSRPQGLYCPPGDFYIDPWAPVDRALITHAHGDHARPGSASYLSTPDCAALLRTRLGEVSLQTLRYGEALQIGQARVSLHPAGHVLGSAQIRIEAAGEVWVVAGDYKLAPDPTCVAFEPIRCHCFVSESTFALPIYRWLPPDELMHGIRQWWQENAAEGRCSILYCYALGKAQRILAGLTPADGPVLTHGAVERLNEVYRGRGVPLPPTQHATGVSDRASIARALVLAPPSASGSTWARRFGDAATGFASGWMQVRGARRQARIERGFVLSDHADWPGLLGAIAATGAERVLATHGKVEALVRYLGERGVHAAPLRTEYGDEDDAAEATERAAGTPSA